MNFFKGKKPSQYDPKKTELFNKVTDPFLRGKDARDTAEDILDVIFKFLSVNPEKDIEDIEVIDAIEVEQF